MGGLIQLQYRRGVADDSERKISKHVCGCGLPLIPVSAKPLPDVISVPDVDDSGTWNTSVLVIGYRIELTLPKAFAPMAFFFTLADIGPHHQASLFQ